MKANNVAFLDETSRFEVREDRGDYGVEPFYQAQGLVGEALNLAGLLLVSLEDECDARAMQIHTAVQALEDKLQAAYRQLGRHELQHAGLFLEAPDRTSD